MPFGTPVFYLAYLIISSDILSVAFGGPAGAQGDRELAGRAHFDGGLQLRSGEEEAEEEEEEEEDRSSDKI